MTSISGSFTSPLARMQSSLSSAIQAGTISSSDKDALSGALTSIDNSMKSERPSGDPKAKIEGLIDAQVSSGSLTADQASELKDLFAHSAPQGGAGGPKGPGGPQGAGGPPPPPPPDDASSSSSSSSSSDQVQELLTNFLKQLQETLGSSGYNANASTSKTAASLVFDTSA